MKEVFLFILRLVLVVFIIVFITKIGTEPGKITNKEIKFKNSYVRNQTKKHPYYTFCFETKWDNIFNISHNASIEELSYKDVDADEDENLKHMIEKIVVHDLDPGSIGVQELVEDAK